MKRTKYFGGGVSASIWRLGPPEEMWEIKITRSSRICFLDLDSASRAVQRYRDNPNGEMFGSGTDSWRDPMIFESHEAAEDCIRNIRLAILYIQGETKAADWHPVPPAVFEPDGGRV